MITMPRFLFQPDSIDGYEFNPIPIDIHLGILKIPTEEILDDFGINTTESVIVGTDRLEVLNRIQSAFAREFEHYGKLKESDIRPMDYKTKQAWSRIGKHIKDTNQVEEKSRLLLSFKNCDPQIIIESHSTGNLIPRMYSNKYEILAIDWGCNLYF